MRSLPASEKHSIERPACVVRVHTVFGRPVSFAGGAAEGVTSFVGPRSFVITVFCGCSFYSPNRLGTNVGGVRLQADSGTNVGSVRLQADRGGELSLGRGKRTASAMRSGRDLQIRKCTVLISFRGKRASTIYLAHCLHVH